MRMSPYPVLCYTPECGQLAEYKIAARWSDGITAELKTYALCCAKCVASHYRAAVERSAKCRRAPGETLDTPFVFEYARERCDKELQRLPTLES